MSEGSDASKLVWLEITILVVIGAIQTFGNQLIEKLAAPPNLLLSDLGLFVLALLALVPAARVKKTAVVCVFVLQLVLVAVSSSYGVPALFDVLYMLYIARTGLLLQGERLAALVVAAVVAHVLSKELRYMLTERYIYALTPAQHLVHLLIAGRVVNFALLSTLAAFCTAAVLGERKLRAERQSMNEQIAAVSRELERVRLAREIHDSAGHIMTAMCMHIDVAAALILKKRDKALTSLATADSLVKQLSQEFHVLEKDAAQTDLCAALQELFAAYENGSAFQLHVDVASVSLPDSVTHDLVSMVKEGLHNITKYAAATRVWFSLREEDGKVVAQLKDDGKGFNLSDVRTTSFGLQGMRERVNKHAGNLEIDSAPGCGTTLKIILPANPVVS